MGFEKGGLVHLLRDVFFGGHQRFVMGDVW